MYIADAHKDEVESYVEVHHEMLRFCPVFTNLRPESYISAAGPPNAVPGIYSCTLTYAIGRAIAHLLRVASPNARICLAGPSISLTLESART